MDNPEYLTAEARGRRLFALLERRISDPLTTDVVQTDININYKVRSDESPATVPKNIEGGVDGEHSRWRQVNISSPEEDKPAYVNFMNPDLGFIVCVFNFKDMDSNSPGNRLEWSQLLFQAYKEEAAREPAHPLTNLNKIWRVWVVNLSTHVLIGLLKKTGESGESTLYRPEHRGFYVLLGSPNCSEVVRMLTESYTALGCKTIESIDVISGSPQCLCIQLKDCAPPSESASNQKKIPKISAGKLRRREKRSAASESTSRSTEA